MHSITAPYVIAENSERQSSIEPAFFDPAAVPVVLTFNKKYIPGGAALIASIVHHASDERKYDIIVFCDDIEGEDHAKLHTIIGGRANFSLRFFDVRPYFSGINIHSYSYFSKESFYRLQIPNILRSFKKVIYIDADAVANRDVGDLMDVPLDGCCIGAVRDYPVNWETAKSEEIDYNHVKMSIEDYNRNIIGVEGDKYFNSGVLVFDNDQINKDNMQDKVLSLIGKKFRMYDQDILNKAFNGRVKHIDSRWNVMPVKNAFSKASYRNHIQHFSSPYIVHFIGKEKPWMNSDVRLSLYYWSYIEKTPYLDEVLDMVQEKAEPAKPALGTVRSSAKVVGYMLFPLGKRRKRKKNSLLRYLAENRL